MDVKTFFPQVRGLRNMIAKKYSFSALEAPGINQTRSIPAKPLANKAKRELSPTKLKSYGENIARINYYSRKKLGPRVRKDLKSTLTG
jgi:hypothetical protein